MLLAEGPIDPSRPGGDELYHFFRGAVDWCSRLPEGQTFKVEARAWACSNVPTSLLMQVSQLPASTCVCMWVCVFDRDGGWVCAAGQAEASSLMMMYLGLSVTRERQPCRGRRGGGGREGKWRVAIMLRLVWNVICCMPRRIWGAGGGVCWILKVQQAPSSRLAETCGRLKCAEIQLSFSSQSS